MKKLPSAAEVRECSKCRLAVPASEIRPKTRQCRTCLKKADAEYRARNRDKARQVSLKYRRSLKGHLIANYGHIKKRCADSCDRSARYRNRDILFSREEYVEFGLSNESYLACYEKWKLAGFPRELSPTVDRIDNTKGYSLDNIQFMTNAENLSKAWVQGAQGNYQPYSTAAKARLAAVRKYDDLIRALDEAHQEIDRLKAEAEKRVWHGPLRSASGWKETGPGKYAWSPDERIFVDGRCYIVEVPE